MKQTKDVDDEDDYRIAKAAYGIGSQAPPQQQQMEEQEGKGCTNEDSISWM